MSPIVVILTLWRYGHMSESEVTEWAWKQVAKESSPSPELLELAMDGVKRCLMRCEADFGPRPIELTYEQEFSLRAVRTDHGSDESLFALANWAAGRAMGEDLNDPLVKLGYSWDYLIVDCRNPKAAIGLARKALPEVMPRCHAVAGAFVVGA